ncbi:MULTISPECIES: hypothetical protein [unclassified Streptomyces]|uniref:hypothetical protein n=1 Tax=unclassified Streptomyces TaxID=2593676 RepID=UPI00131EDA7B|nr:hypothetical protein [Streptomyces sp. 303MFCol5.2]
MCRSPPVVPGRGDGILTLGSPARLVRGRRQTLCLFLPDVRGRGCAAEARGGARRFADAVPDEPVVLHARIADDRSTRLAAKPGFTEVQRCEEWGAEQWFGGWSSVAPPC